MLEKITELKSVENEVKALSECVGGQAGLKRENSDLTGVSTQKPGQLPGKSPTPECCKGEESPGVKHERKPLQKSNKEKVEVLSSSIDKSEKHGAPSPIKWSRDEMIQVGIATKKRKSLVEKKVPVYSRDAVCFMHKKPTAKKGRVPELDGDYLFQCEHAWVNMLKAAPEEIPPEGLCTKIRDYYSHLKRAEHLLAEPLQKMVWDDSRHLIGECMTFLKATPQERFTKAAADGDVCFTCLTRGCPTGKSGRCLNRN